MDMPDTPPATPPSREDLLRCQAILETLGTDSRLFSPLSSEERLRFLLAAGQVVYPDKLDIRRRVKDSRRERRKAQLARDRAVRASTAIRVSRLDAVFVPSPRVASDEAERLLAQARELEDPRDCYVCKKEFTRLHFHYDSMCPECAQFNYEKRFQRAPLDGRVALITGARLKIGYQAALMMLRSGARVIVTTRFPQDAALRYAREPDFDDWRERLEIHGLDLRHSPSVELFARQIESTHERLDFLINNAAQTVRRPPGFYAHLLETERTPHEALPEPVRRLLAGHERFKAALEGSDASAPAGIHWLSDWHGRDVPARPGLGLTASAELSQIPYRFEDAGAHHAALFPQGKLDADLQQVDLRAVNSWRLALADVPTAEMLEVQLVNAVAPFILCSKLKGLMLRHPTGDRHIVNVSAMEGKFQRHTKTDKHPHTNMAKAALNMLTLTSARDYAKSGIFMNAVDTGWVTDEDPADLSQAKQEQHDFQPPLDIVDGAARVCDPFFSGLLTGKHSWGNFLKDYFPTDW